MFIISAISIIVLIYIIYKEVPTNYLNIFKHHLVFGMLLFYLLFYDISRLEVNSA